MKWVVVCDECGDEKTLGMDNRYDETKVKKLVDILNQEKLLNHRCSGEYRLKHGSRVVRQD